MRTRSATRRMFAVSALASLVDSQWGDQLMSQKAMSSYTVISFTKGSPGELNRISGVFDWRFTAATNSRGTLTRKVVCASVRFTATLSKTVETALKNALKNALTLLFFKATPRASPAPPWAPVPSRQFWTFSCRSCERRAPLTNSLAKGRMASMPWSA